MLGKRGLVIEEVALLQQSATFMDRTMLPLVLVAVETLTYMATRSCRHTAMAIHILAQHICSRFKVGESKEVFNLLGESRVQRGPVCDEIGLTPNF